MPSMPALHLVGIDLAWGDRQPTGLAVLDESGRLVHIGAVRTDDEIETALAPYADGGCVVAIDAPLIVRNATGNRPAEAALNRDFARFDAGAHPSNTAKPEFADGTRGQRIAGRLGLDLNPRSGRPKRAIEVYPHPATVALFRLGRTLKYKNKPGRTLVSLRGDLLSLMNLVEGLADADVPLQVAGPAWAELRGRVEQAQRKSELRVVEDQVDAVLCAYVALLSVRAPDRVRVYGDEEPGGWQDGYIVTPVLPADHIPTPRERRSAGPARSGVDEYAAQHRTLVEAGHQAVALVEAVLDEAGINYLSVTGRTKSIASFAEKASRTREGRLLYADPLREITDQLGVRVVTYVLSDVDVVADLLADHAVVVDDRDMGRETADEGRFGYASRHLLLEVPAGPEHQLLGGRIVQVQIRTVLQHAWAEFEHAIRYKGTIPAEHASDLDRRFTLAAGLLELADREFTTIRDRLRSTPAEPVGEPAAVDDPRLDPPELAAFLAGQYADAGWSRADHYAWISGLLLELGVTSFAELAEVLRPTGDWRLNERMGYRYPPGAVRRLDDALLAVFGERYVDLHGNGHRATLLRQRLERLRAAGPLG
jgi:predicted RNase H-like nuclease/ppGpp synthetase/RelA/SpoT-type nucleotidyltranferase